MLDLVLKADADRSDGVLALLEALDVALDVLGFGARVVALTVGQQAGHDTLPADVIDDLADARAVELLRPLPGVVQSVADMDGRHGVGMAGGAQELDDMWKRKHLVVGKLTGLLFESVDHVAQ